MSSMGAEQVPVIACYGPAVGVIDRRHLTYLELKAAHERVCARQESMALWSLGSFDMTLLLDEIGDGHTDLAGTMLRAAIHNQGDPHRERSVLNT